MKTQITQFSILPNRSIALVIASMLMASCFGSLATASEKGPEGLHRMLLFKFKDDATPLQIEAVKETFCQIRGKVEGMNRAVWATDLKLSADSKFTHAAILSFESEEAVAAYEEHPDHQALTVMAPPIISNFFEMNFETDATNVSE